MRKKKILIFAYLIISGVVFILIYGFIRKIESKRLIESRIKFLPEFTFTKLSGEKFKSAEITKGPLVIMYFHPECEHCRYEISELVKNKDLINNYDFLIISNAEKEEIENFYYETGLDNHPGIKLLLDEDYKFSEIFGAGYVPSIYLYDLELRLIKSFKGEVNPDILVKYLIHDKPE